MSKANTLGGLLKLIVITYTITLPLPKGTSTKIHSHKATFDKNSNIYLQLRALNLKNIRGKH